MRMNTCSRLMALGAIVGALACAGNTQEDTDTGAATTTTRDTAMAADTAMTDTTMADDPAGREAGDVTQTPGDSVRLTDTLSTPTHPTQKEDPSGYGRTESDTSMAAPETGDTTMSRDTSGFATDSATMEADTSMMEADTSTMEADTSSLQAELDTSSVQIEADTSTLRQEGDTAGTLEVELDTTTPPQR